MSRRSATAWTRMPPAQRPVALALAGIMAVAVLLAALDLLGDGDVAGSPPAGRVMPRAVAEVPLAAIAERPLFRRSRRPEPPAPPMPPPSAPPPPPRDRQIGLKGVYINGAEAKAFVTSADQPEGAWVSQGSRVGGWNIAAVSAEQVRLEADGETFSASLNPGAGHP